MNIRIQALIFITVVISLIVIINMVKKRKLELKYTLVWFALGVGVMLFNLFPSLIYWLSNLVGIAEPMNMLFFFGFCVLLIVIFTLTKTISKMSVEIKDLAQYAALLEERISNMETGNTNS